MATIPKRTSQRYLKAIPKFQEILKNARNRDINDADTVTIIQGIWSDCFGYDEYMEITSEFAIRGTYCDLAIKIDDKIQFLIEAKAVGIELKPSHLRQVVDYGAKEGVQWVVLTNGISWELHRIHFEKPINTTLVCEFSFLDINPRKLADQEILFLLSKKGLKSARDDFYERTQTFNRFVVAALIKSKPITDVIKRSIRKLAPGIKIEDTDIDKILTSEVLKREVIDGNSATKATQRVKKLTRKPVPKRATAIVIKKNSN